jgi:hypothetical protein
MKEETLITGDITGYVNCIGPFYSLYAIEGSATVDLMTDTTVIATQQTSNVGKFTFTDIPYGKFKIRTTKPGFVPAWTLEPVYHAGGATPTCANTTLYEVPTFQLVYDSIAYSADAFAHVMYMHFSDPSVLPRPFSGLSCFAFFSDQPTVDRFTFAISISLSGFIWDTNSDGIFDSIIGNGSYPGAVFSTLPENLYVRLYAVAFGQGYYSVEVVPGAFGPPSEVFAFKNPFAR